MEEDHTFFGNGKNFKNTRNNSKFTDYRLHYGTTLTQLPNVASENRESVLLIKSLINMLNVVLDDIGDEEKNFNLIKKITGCQMLNIW